MKLRWQNFYLLSLIFSGSFLLLNFQEVKAQQDPQYSHYMFSELNYNPAFAGNHERRICATFLQHNQWTQFEGIDGGSAPNTQVFNVHAPLINDFVQGAGLAIFNDQQGFESTVSVLASASHKREFSFGRLSLGLNIGYIQKQLNGNKLKAIEDGDPLIPNKEVSKGMFDVGIGAFLTGRNYYVGLSGLHLNQPKLGWSLKGGGEAKYFRHFYLSGGYNYDLNEEWSFKPSALFKFDGAKLVSDVNLRATLQDKYWGGLGYRIGENAMNAMLGMYLTPKLKVGYSFDLPFNPNDIKSGGTHEVLIGYCFNFNPEPKEEFPIWTPRHL